jgi:hypothetical protein
MGEYVQVHGARIGSNGIVIEETSLYKYNQPAPSILLNKEDAYCQDSQ